MKKVVIYGAGFNGRLLYEMLGSHDFIGFIDNNPERTNLGGMEWILKNRDVPVIISIGNNIIRYKIAEKLRSHNISIGSYIHPTAFIMNSVQMSSGRIVYPRVVIMHDVGIGNDVIINTGAIIEHDCVLGDCVNISPGVKMAGLVRVGERSFIGIGSIIGPRVKIGKDCIIGAGSLVINDIPDGMLAYGSPAEVKGFSKDVNWKEMMGGKR